MNFLLRSLLVGKSNVDWRGWSPIIVLAIVSFGLISLSNARELASGGGLARGVCGYMTVFWGIRLTLQGVLDIKKHLTAWSLKAGYQILTALCTSFTLVYGFAALRPLQ